MKIFDRLSVIRFAFRREGRADRDVLRRWTEAAARDPQLVEDVIRLSGFLEHRTALLEGGDVVPEPIDPVRLAYDQGRRDMAGLFLALMNVTPHDLNQLIGAPE